MDYYKPMRDAYIQKEMYPTEYRKDYFPKSVQNDSLKIGPKAPCIPRFVTKIEGNAVEEGARVFFEGIVDSQPQPIFSWYFDDEEVVPGERGWEDVEIHHSRKMSTFIIRYAREHHMGKYTLVAQNRLGHDISNCDLIVRKKQFPPVFWKRLVDTETSSGARLVAEVEVGGWPLPEVTWYKEDEIVTSQVHTENYNGFPNRYVPERRIEVKQIDHIRYSLVFHRISESDSGIYTCQAVNPLGEAFCEAEFIIGPGEGGVEDLYLPEKWLTGNRLSWKMEDQRLKPCVGYQEPELSPEDGGVRILPPSPVTVRKEYVTDDGRFLMEEETQMQSSSSHSYSYSAAYGQSSTTTIINGQVESQGSSSFPGNIPVLEDKYSVAENLEELATDTHNPYQDETFADDQSGEGFEHDFDRRHIQPEDVLLLQQEHTKRQEMMRSQETSISSAEAQFTPGDINHRGYRCDDTGRILPIWKNPLDPHGRDPAFMEYMTVPMDFPPANAPPPEVDGPHGPPYWESDETIQKLYEMLRNMGWRVDVNEIRSDRVGNKAQARKQETDGPTYLQEQVKARRQVMQNTPRRGDHARDEWEERLNANVPGAQGNAEDFTNQFMSQLRTDNAISSSSSAQESHFMHSSSSRDSPPSLPPKTKIMFSPSRQVFSPTNESEVSSVTTSTNTVEFIPVKEKAKMIAMQQEQIVRKEEVRRQEGKEEGLKGGVRILPPSPVTDYFPKSVQNDSLKIGPKAPCIPRFVTKIEGNAVEEGARVFFEGIVDSQPQPIFSWYFDDEEVVPGERGWEDVEIHHSRKMSTFIIRYAREHHMGKYTLVAQNRLGHDISNCDLIVRKKQFPPVFWKRLVDTETSSGARLVAEVEVGGWPLPEVTWYKEDEIVTSQVHTENYNGFPNRYVPERRIEVKQIDHIRYSLVFHRISESDSGIYTCQAVNPLGEALCEAEFIIGPGEGSVEDLYLPEKWLTGNRLSWKMEDQRLKPCVGYQEPELSPEDVANMTKNASSTPLPRAMEYLASLPDYEPTPLSKMGLTPLSFTPESALQGIQKRPSGTGGTAPRPSKFTPGDINHRGYRCDDTGRILPIWKNPLDPHGRDPAFMEYMTVPMDFPPANAPPPEVDGPHGPPYWESDETIQKLYEMLRNMGWRVDVNEIRSDRVGNKAQARKQETDGPTYLQEQVKARRQVMQNTPRRGDHARDEWEERLNANVPGAQGNAEDFTNQFMSQLRTDNAIRSSSSAQESHFMHSSSSRDSPPSLPPKTKIMFSPSRQVFSPTNESEVSSVTTSTNTVEFIPVKEKAKMIAMQQEQIVRKEEVRRQEGKEEGLKGGVRILPPSPVTVRKEYVTDDGSFLMEEETQMQSSSSHSYSYSAAYGQSSTTTIINGQVESQGSSSFPGNIPVLEDKYSVAENLEELATDTHNPYQDETFADDQSGEGFEHDFDRRHIQPEDVLLLQQEHTKRQEMMRSQETSISSAEAQVRNRKTSFEMERLELEPRVQFKEDGRNQLVYGSGSKSTPATPSSQRRFRAPSQSSMTDDDDRIHYREPPTEPFKPGFYKKPNNNPQKNFNPSFRLPHERRKKSEVKFASPLRVDDYDGDTEF
eukprot:TCALIF_11690-PA protein Name:"Similar to Palld Palladin (Mus musculus)" AED:0.35 eAED:0.35 QI:5/0/0/0.28/1/0.85/7/0/1595